MKAGVYRMLQLPSDLQIIQKSDPFPTAEQIPSGLKWLEFEFLGVKLGNGGAAKEGVHLAFDLELQRKVAIKAVPLSVDDSSPFNKFDCCRVQWEATIGILLGVHPNILQVEKTLTDKTTVFLVLQYEEGACNLEVWLPQERQKVKTGQRTRSELEQDLLFVFIQLIDAVA
ncbi:hypothetical protein HDU93_009788 [Gonapodya sp. JEL0774]|nr:hypothetical protein HDU93_009788 [Gonapodya sp. JEL0774]